MWTGRQTLSQIETTIGKLHRDESELDGALASATAQAERLRKERSEAFRELARVKLAEIEAGRLVRDLDAAERRAVQILEGRRLRLQNTNEQRAGAIVEVEDAEKSRHAAAAAVEAALETVEAIRAKAEEHVKATAAWADASKALAAADAVAGQAEKKATQSEDELRAKKKPYDDDRLFAYLWSNGFGTERYRAGNLARMVDRAMADFIGFAEARASYAMLAEIPLRLREHATLERAEAGERQKALGEIERRAMVADGIEAHERTLAEARHKLAAADDITEKKRAILKSLDDRRDALVNGTGDQAYKDALRTIAEADAQDDVATLQQEAQRTATGEDDAIVRRIGQLAADLERADGEIASLRQSAQELARRRGDVERVRDRFRSAGYDHPNARFGNEIEIGQILGQILEGAVRSGILWDILRGGFSTRPSRNQPDFGQPTFPFPFPMPGGGRDDTRGGEWREPGTRGGWSPPPLDFPSSSGGGGGGSDDSGGFTTGETF